MDKQIILRNIFKILTLTIFIFQVQNSLSKYYARPVVEERSMTTKDKTRQPSVYVCEDNQFNTTKSQAVGYDHIEDLKAGKLANSDKYTWKGANGNLTFEEIQAIAYDTDYSNFKAVTSETKELFIAPHGFCMKLVDTVSEQFIKTVRKSMLLLVDPRIDNDIRIVEMNHGRLYCGPTTPNLYDAASYEMEYSLKDSKIYDGVSCTDYEKINSSYGQCIKELMKEELLKCYGCLPSWFPTKMGLTCEKEKDIIIQDGQICEKLYDDLLYFILGRDLKMFEPCMPPCLKMSLSLKRTYHISNSKTKSYLSVISKNDVEVLKATYSYDIFNLVVDIGSALGLWLGLSALNILDNTFLLYSWMTKKKNHSLMRKHRHRRN